jgi:hypothetical protein
MWMSSMTLWMKGQVQLEAAEIDGQEHYVYTAFRFRMGLDNA